MKKRVIAALAALVLLAAAALCVLRPWEPKLYEPKGGTTGDEALDAQVLELLQELCGPGAAAEENLGAVYDWIAAEIAYRPGTADTSGGFTDELTAELAGELLRKRRGNCDGEAALTAVLLRRMGYECRIVTGQFLREDGAWVDHAWVIARVDGAEYHFDPLYGHFYAENPRDFFLCPDAAMEATHRWAQ